MLWDKIILRGEHALLDYRSMNTKYYFWDDGNGLVSHKNVTLTLSWNVIPTVGYMPRWVGIWSQYNCIADGPNRSSSLYNS